MLTRKRKKEKERRERLREPISAFRPVRPGDSRRFIYFEEMFEKGRRPEK